MILEKLQQTDESLIKLLHNRLSILAASGLPTVEEQLSSVASLIAQVGLPESVWANVVMGCIAALTTTPSTRNNIRSRNITIIGGRGRMGRFFTQQLSTAGHNVSVLEHQDWEYADKLLSQAELVLVSVPIERTVDVIKRAAKYLDPLTALADITSIKVQPVQAMLEHHIGPVMGLHPMFGPSIKSFSEQKIVVCSGRNDDSFQWFLDWMESKGSKLIFCTPQEHDQIMVFVQATQHFSGFSLGVFLATQRIDLESSLSMSSPNYRQAIDIVNRLFAQSPTLCIDIMLATQERCHAIEKLANTYSRIAQLVVKQDRAALIEEFVATQSFFASKSIHSQKKSDYAILLEVGKP